MNREPTVQKTPEHYKGVDEQTGSKSRTIMSVPLHIDDKSIGVLQVLNKTDGSGATVAYSEHDSVLLLHLGRLAAAAINHARLVRKLTAQMGLYTRDASDDLVSRLDQPVQRESVSLLFADMRGFTQLCQSQAADPGRTQEIMNELFTMFADRVLSRGGIVNKFVGDAVFAIFRKENGAKAAVRCAFDMLERFDSLRRRWTESCNEDVSFLDIGIGISTGAVALGTFGSGMVRDFTAIGTAVNLAAAFEYAARNGRRVLVDNATWQKVQDIVEDHDDPEPFEVVRAGQVIAKYRHVHLKRLTPDRPVRVFVSHNHKDREFVETRITAPLAAHSIETWYSNSDIIPGERYIQRIEDGLLKCDWVLVVVTENAVASDWVRAEVKTAMADPRFQNRILPLLSGDVGPGAITAELAELHSIDVAASPDLGDYLHKFFQDREVELRAAAKRA